MHRVVDFIPRGKRNRPGFKLDGPHFITIHDTANPRAGANALAHASYLKGDAAASLPVSWHFTVDDRYVIQHLPTDEVAWHAGDGAYGPGNRTSIAIEICQNADGDRAKAEGNAVALTAQLLQQFNLPLDAVVQHHRWSGKNCPNLIRARVNGWPLFLRGVEVQLEVLKHRQKQAPKQGTPLLGSAQASVEAAQQWARANGATEEFISLAPIYWSIAPERGNVRPDAAYAQAAKETGFGRFGGVIDRTYHNPCGLKTTAGGKDDDPGAHQRFADWEEGITAHLDHLALYAGAPGYPKQAADTPDPRHFPWLLGKAATFEELGGAWASSATYGHSIVRDYLEPLLATAARTDSSIPGDSSGAGSTPNRSLDYRALYEAEKLRADRVEKTLRLIYELARPMFDPK